MAFFSTISINKDIKNASPVHEIKKSTENQGLRIIYAIQSVYSNLIKLVFLLKI